MTTRKSQSDDALALLEAEARAVAKSFGIPDSDAAAAALMDRITLRLGGAHIYVPKKRAETRAQAQALLRTRFDGENLRQLAREIGVSVRHARRLLGK